VLQLFREVDTSLAHHFDEPIEATSMLGDCRMAGWERGDPCQPSVRGMQLKAMSWLLDCASCVGTSHDFAALQTHLYHLYWFLNLLPYYPEERDRRASLLRVEFGGCGPPGGNDSAWQAATPAGV
jgi:hypothetical protein